MLLYLLGIILPPLAILVYGRILAAALNGMIWTYALLTPDLTGTIAWICASLHAAYVIHEARLGRFSGHTSRF